AVGIGGWVDGGGGRTCAPGGREPRLLAHPREQCGRPSALRQAGGALRLHPISQAFLTRFAGLSMTIALTAPIAPTRRLFLGVERSACGRAWRDRLDERDAARALAIAQRHPDVPELLARILAGRGVEVDEVASFLDPTVRTLMPDPHTLAGMRDAATRLADAVTRGETIAILGDYDVDGATSAALLGRYLHHCGLRPIVHIPDRLFEGYRPNTQAGSAPAPRRARPPPPARFGPTTPQPPRGPRQRA